ncbi:MAG: D-2-hydroxyacid dehydrogenase family protein [Chitinophagales bacterium]|nr:D-2-hydroxyacid dehydrogenase family protein [Chitinophagales bacterium]
MPNATPKIAILDDYQHVIKTLRCFDMLKERNVVVHHQSEKDPQVLAGLLQDVEILVLTRERTIIGEALLSQLPRLKLISQTGKISNHLDLAACTRYKVAVAEGIGSPIAPAELSWALLMNTVRQIPQAIAAMKQGQWQTNIGGAIHGKTIGIWGYGKIGQRMAQYARVFGAKVLVWGSENARNKAIADGFESAPDKTSFFQTADIITLHLRLNAATTGIVKAADLQAMKPDSVLINTARAELIEQGALLAGLKAGRPAFAGLDVYEEEPVYDKAHPLLQMSNVVCTPHLGYVERQGYELYFGKAFENVLAYLEGRPKNIANPEVL